MNSLTSDKKSLIIQAAIKIFARDGLVKGKIADIAEEADIGKGTVYEYFRSKEEIFQAIEQMMYSGFTAEFEAIKSSDLSPSAKIRQIMISGLDVFVNMGEAMLIITELWAQTMRGHYHGSSPSQVQDFYEQYKNEVESILEDGIRAGEIRTMNKQGVATLLLAFLDGLGLQFMVMKNPQKFNRIKTEAIESLMKGITK